ncbi:hypothetical protein [Amycolatopsis keratiniphila]|uniref:hypothetical protein n=1 Tax=Amycolatopsis keratiniphila TaxID=129921 RepID=UPI000A52D5A9|nr:hypothetical protein [Amycolatopsis keratiniphila]
MTAEQKPVVDVEDPDTWPDRLADRVQELAQKKQDTVDALADFDNSYLNLWDRNV